MIKPPRFLTQSQVHDPENGIYGTCMAACMAMLIGCDEEDIPLRYLVPPHDHWWETLSEDLERLGWIIVHYRMPNLIEPKGWHMINGLSPRGFGHSCIGYRGELIWDPHPSRDGLVNVQDYYVLTPLIPDP